jgi:hypothetical protein
MKGYTTDDEPQPVRDHAPILRSWAPVLVLSGGASNFKLREQIHRCDLT